MSEREIERWVTIRGHRVPIYKGETEEDVHNRFLESIGESSKKDYSKYDDKKKMIDDFTQTNQMFINGRGDLEKCNMRVLADTFNTIESVSNEYGVRVSDIHSFVSLTDNAYVSESSLYLNTDLFSREELLNRSYREDAANRYHPKAPNGAIGVVSHELGHMIFYKHIDNILEKYDGTDTTFEKVHDWLTEGGTPDFAEGSKAYNVYKELDSQFKKIEKKLNSKNIVETMGSTYKYGGKNYHETVAEAFCDVYCNGNNAAEVSKVVYDEICKPYKKGK